MKTGSQVFEKTIEAGGIAAIEQEGDFFWLIESPITVNIKIAGGTFMPYQQDTGEDYARVGEFKRIEIQNPSIYPIKVIVYVGGSRYLSGRTSVMEPATEIVGWDGSSLAATTGVTFPGIPSGTQVRRKCIQVTNEDPNINLQLRDIAGNVCLVIFAETSITLPISRPVELYNPNGAPVACRFSEIFWAS